MDDTFGMPENRQAVGNGPQILSFDQLDPLRFGDASVTDLGQS